MRLRGVALWASMAVACDSQGSTASPDAIPAPAVDAPADVDGAASQDRVEVSTEAGVAPANDAGEGGSVGAPNDGGAEASWDGPADAPSDAARTFVRRVLLEDFDRATLPTQLGLGAQSAAKLELIEGLEAHGGVGKSLKVTYPAQAAGTEGAVFAWGGVGLRAYATRAVLVRFRAKMPSAKCGLKFLKVFGERNGPNYANTTFGLDYTGIEDGTGSLYAIAFGDGTAAENDAQNAIMLSGVRPEYAGRSFGLPGFSIQTPQRRAFRAEDWGAVWHDFELSVRFNSGTTAADETNDGAATVRVDGTTYADARGLFNRHPTNGPIESVQILGWSQPPRGQAVPAFELWYDDFEVWIDGD